VLTWLLWMMRRVHPAWEIGDGVLLPQNHDLCLGFFGQGVHEAVIKLGIVLGCPLFLANVGFSIALDLVHSKLSIVVEEVNEVLIGFEEVLWEHQDVHPAASDGPVFQGC